MSEAMLGVYRAIGEDRHVSASELPPESGTFGRTAWEVYDRHFGRFTGAAIDPELTRLDRPDARFGSPVFPSSRPIVVHTGGAVSGEAAAFLSARRDDIVLLAAPAGADVLRALDVDPDLVLVGRERAGDTSWDRRQDPAPESACLVDPAVPPLAWERRRSGFWLARPTYSWGSWPANAVAIALAGGATTVALVGARSPEKRACRTTDASDALLALLAEIPGPRFLDLDEAPSPAGWTRADWDAVGSGSGSGPGIEWRDEGGFDLVLANATRDAARVSAVLADAHDALGLAQRARAGAAIPRRELTRTIETVLAWGCDPCLRWALQGTLGLTFLPRLWRTGISMAAPDRLWRPLMLAVQELTDQARRLDSRLLALRRADLPLDAAGAHLSGGSRLQARMSDRPIDPARVSVVIPVTDGRVRIAAAVKSVLAQTYTNLEVLVVHHPGCAETCADLRAIDDDRVRLLECGRDLAEAMNVGLEAATGGLIALHGADDLSHPHRIARQVAYLQAHEDIAVVATATAVVDEDGSRVTVAEADPATPDEAWTPEAIERHLLFGRCFEAGSVLARRSVIEWAGGYRTRLATAPDQDLWLRLLPTARFAKLPTRLHARRAGAVSHEDAPVAAAAIST